MVKTRKKPKHRIKGRQPPKKKSKPSHSLVKSTSPSSPVKWILIFSVIAVVGTAAIWGTKSIVRSFQNTEKKPTAPLTKPAGNSTVPEKSTAELETAALKNTEAKLVQTIMRDFPNSEDALKLVADFHSRHGRRIEAVKYWQQCLDKNPGRIDVYRNLGDVAIDAGEFEEAIVQYRKAINIDSKADGIHDKMGQALVELGRYDEAVKELEKARFISTRSAVVHFLLGQAHLKLKQHEKARIHYHEALEIDPGYENAYYGLVRAYAGLKQQEKAREYQTKFRNLEALRMKEDRDMSTGTNLYTRDLAKLRRAVATTHLDAEKLYLAGRDIPKTEELLKRAIEIDPDNTSCYERLGALYNMTNRPAEAVRQFRRISEIEPTNIYSYLNMGRILTRLKKHDAAKEAYARVIQIEPEQAVGYCELARLYLMTNTNLVEAGKLAKKAVNLESSAESLFVLAWAMYLNNDRSGASKAIQEAIKLEPNNPKYRQIYERIKGTN
ncbi:MAG: tetratricopeptide repeat protein [Planctomycetota bacterium]|jgi:tetratricopeptide (TPR) repeat protein